jgi:hypothetical protein
VVVRIRGAKLRFNVWNIRKVTSHYFSDCFPDQGTFKKANWQLGSKCSSSYSTLKTSIASRILTPTGGVCIAEEASKMSTALLALSAHCELNSKMARQNL